MLPKASLLLRSAKLCWYLLIGLFLLVASFVLRVANKSCSTARANDVRSELCSMYHRGEVVGNMCSTLCDKKQLQLDFCGNNRARIGRKDVLVMSCKGCDRSMDKLVMKIQVTPSKWNNATDIALGGKEQMSVDNMLKETRTFTKEQIKMYFDKNNFVDEMDIVSTLLRDMSGSSFLSADDPKTAHTALKTILALVLQPEVIILLALRKTQFMPKVYGYCGPAYFVEYTPSINSLGYVVTTNTKSSDLLNMKFQVKPWHERVHIALKFLDIIRLAESLDVQKTLQICDFKPHNFGLNADNSLMFLDSDDLTFFLRHLGRPCTSDDQCFTNYCSGHCDKRTNKCIDKRKENNLQIACIYVFLGDYELFGLLRSPPDVVSKELNDVLQRCSYPKRYNKSAVTDKVDYKMLDKIELLLRKSINVS